MSPLLTTLPPNTALHRAPSAPPPSPVSFQTFGHKLAVLGHSIIALTVAAVMCGEEPWVRTESKAGRFVVSMPARATESTKLAETAHGAFEFHISLCRLGDARFGVTYFDYPVEYIKARDSKAILDNARDGAVANTQGTLLSEELITKNGYPGREFKISVAGGKATSQARVFLVGSRLYSLVVATPVSEAYSPSMRRFFDSFQILPESGTK